MDNSMEIPQNIKNRIFACFYKPTSGMEQKNGNQDIEEISALMFIAALFTITKVWKTPNIHQ